MAITQSGHAIVPRLPCAGNVRTYLRAALQENGRLHCRAVSIYPASLQMRTWIPGSDAAVPVTVALNSCSELAADIGPDSVIIPRQRLTSSLWTADIPQEQTPHKELQHRTHLQTRDFNRGRRKDDVEINSGAGVAAGSSGKQIINGTNKRTPKDAVAGDRSDPFVSKRTLRSGLSFKDEVR